MPDPDFRLKTDTYENCIHCKKPFSRNCFSNFRRSERHVLAAFRCLVCDAPLDGIDDNAPGYVTFYCPLTGRLRVQLSGTELPAKFSVASCGICKSWYVREDQP